MKLDYPVVEAIRSILPLVDEMVVAVGNSEDDTLELIKSIDPNIKIIETIWEDHLREGGKVLALETDKAKAAVDPQSDWLIYIQADECIHEKYHEPIRKAMEQWKDDKRVEGLLLNYLHFYGSYDYLGDSRTWYRQEIRIIKNHPNIKSWKDAQGFRVGARKLNVAKVGAYVYHYGWVRHPKYMMAKSLEANKYWHDDQWIEARFDAAKDFDYSGIDSLMRFQGTHPEVMKQRIENMNWKFEGDPSKKKFGLKAAFLYWFEKHTGYRIGEHRNFKIIK
jgi:hypothetical protein